MIQRRESSERREALLAGLRRERVAVADLAGGAVIATVDVRDMDRFAAHATSVFTADIGRP